jgi:hypothetical protein
MKQKRRAKRGKQRSNPVAPVPMGMQVQLARLFGSDSLEAKMDNRSPAQWKRTLRRVLSEMDRYIKANVETDDVHLSFLYSGLAAAYESLKDRDFWPGYVEGMTRLALILMGDYPDHRKRKGGRRQEDHYQLARCRTIRYIQTPNQKLNTLAAATAAGPIIGINLSKGVFDVLREFREQAGFKVGYKVFLKWYREKYPKDYAAVF